MLISTLYLKEDETLDRVIANSVCLGRDVHLMPISNGQYLLLTNELVNHR
jgi:hypothetical protein